MITFEESRRAQIVNALLEVGAEQVKTVNPKAETELEADRSAAAISLNAAYLREHEARFGKAALRVTAADVLAEALKDARATQDDQ